MLHYVCTIEWKIEIGCHRCSVVMVTSQKSHFFFFFFFSNFVSPGLVQLGY